MSTRRAPPAREGILGGEHLSGVPLFERVVCTAAQLCRCSTVQLFLLKNTSLTLVAAVGEGRLEVDPVVIQWGETLSKGVSATLLARNAVDADHTLVAPVWDADTKKTIGCIAARGFYVGVTHEVRLRHLASQAKELSLLM